MPERAKGCATCRTPVRLGDLVAFWCAPCARRLGHFNDITHVGVHCQRCDSIFWTLSDAALCHPCERAIAKMREGIRRCKACSWPYRATRRGARYCTAGCGSHIIRARRMANAVRQGTHTAAEWAAKLDEHGHRCAYCGADGPLTKDHIRPVSRGGSDLIENIAPACPACNSSKGKATLEEWHARRFKIFAENVTAI